MSQLQHILFRRDRLSLLGAVSLAILVAMTASIFLTAIPQVQAAAPTGTSATMNNSSQSALTVDVVVTGTDFDVFVNSQTTTANVTDRAGISYGGINPTVAIINNATTMTLTFPAATLGTDKTGGSLTIAAGTVEDAGNVANDLITIVDGSITDSASPIVLAINTLDVGSDGATANGKVDHVELFYSEAIVDTAINSYAAAVDYTPTSFAVAVVANEAIDASEAVCPNDAAENDAYLCVIFDEDAGTCSSADQTGCDTDEVDQDVTYTGASVTIQDAGTNAAPDLVSGNITEADEANPVLLGVAKSLTSNLNRISFTYSEPMTVTNGASTATKGDITTAGTVAGFGFFNAAGDVTVATTKNTVGGNGTAVLTVDLAAQAGGYLNSTSTSEPLQFFTAAQSSEVTDASTNQVSSLASNPIPSGGGTWDLVKPTVAITVRDAASNNGKIDQAFLDFSESIRDSSITNADATLGASGTTTGTFTTGTADDDSTTFNRTDDNTVDTSTAAGNFVYSGATTLIADLAGNLYDGTTDGQIATADVTETDGAKPIVTAVDFTKATVSGIAYNIVDITYSEQIFVSDNGDSGNDIAGASSGASSATLADMTSAATLTGIGTWATGTPGDMTTSSAVGNTVALNAGRTILTVRFNTLTSAYFNAGTTAPAVTAFTPVEDANDIDDASGNPVNASQAAVTTTSGTAWDVTKPTIVTTLSQDGGGNAIGFMHITFSENMIDASISLAELEIDNDSTNDAVGETTGSLFFSNARSTCGGVLDTDANDNGVLLSGTVTTVPGTEVAYIHHNTGQIRDHAGNVVTYGDALGTEVDCAVPYLIDVSPDDGSSGVLNSTSLVLTFSEAIDTATIDYTLSAYGGSISDVWSVGDSVLTIDPGGSLSGGVHTLTLNAADDASSTGNAYGGVTDSGTNPFSFTVASSSSGGGGGGSSAATYTINLTSPDGTETALAGDSLNIAWSTGGTGSISYIDLSYSTDGGTSYTMIADNTANDGAYSWTIPNIAGGTSVKVKAEATDLSAVLATDTSASFTLGGSTTPTPSEPVTAPSTGNMGVSPVTGLPEEISQVSAGQYVKSPFFSTVYYVDSSLVRHPFIDSQTYFTWQNTFDVVITVTDATLPTLPLGTPMLPKPGVVLVKIQSVNKVYAVVSNPNDSFKPTLRWIGSESLATQLYGSAWADYVIDIAPTSLSRFLMGEDVITAGDLTVNRSIMKTRNWLNR